MQGASSLWLEDGKDSCKLDLDVEKHPSHHYGTITARKWQRSWFAGLNLGLFGQAAQHESRGLGSKLLAKTCWG